MSPYTDAAQIAAYLGTTFTPEQAAQADVAASAVTAYIDHRTGRSWQAVSPVTAELCPVVVPGPSDRYGAVGRAYLVRCPVISVSAVALRTSSPNDAPEPLDPAAYELIDAAAGVLLLPGYGYGYGSWSGVSGFAVVDYTYQAQAPADVGYAATVLSADLLFPTLHPESAGLESLALGQNDISMKYAGASGGEKSAAVSSAIAVVDSYRRVVLA